MNIFAIIVTYNGRQVPYWYDNCFMSLRKSTIPVQTIVIDNASTDDTVAYIQEYFPEVILIESEKNLGFGQANNIGMRYALDHDADYVFLLNQDAWMEPDTLEKLVQIAEKNLEYGILAPMHLHVSQSRIEPGLMNFLYNSKEHYKTIFNDLYFSSLRDIYTVDYVNAAAWLLPRNTLETIGGFDPIFYHYGEDDNYMQRVHYNGMKIGLCPYAQITHDAGRKNNVPEKSKMSKDKDIVEEMTNILIPNAYDRYMKKQRISLLKKILCCDWNVAKSLYKDMQFVRSIKSKIQTSRTQNMEIGRNWL